jgi:hypothetical protein
MTTRGDIRVIYSTDPRLVIVATPSTELTIQDLHDTLSSIDDDFTSMSFPHTLTTTGKQDLGGGVKVGLTLQLENAQVAFQRRTTKVSTGAVTTNGDIAPDFQTVIDAGATFIADGVARGDIVENLTDGSFAEVVSIDSETQLTVLFPTGGTDNDYDISDSYIVWLHVTGDISGGNLVAVESDGVTILKQTFPTFGVGLVRTSSSSATLQEQADIQFSSFNGGVTIDVVNGISGTAYPIGTGRQPVDNLDDAKLIASANGFMRLYIIGNLNFISTDTLTNFTIVGENEERSMVDIDADAVMDTCAFSGMTLTGTIDDDSRVVDCKVDGLDFRNGEVVASRLQGTMALSGSKTIQFINCSSAVIGTGTPIIDMGGNGPELGIRGYNGGIALQNKTGAASVSIDMVSGQVVIADTVTTGTIVLRGVGKWTNEDTYVGGANVINQLLTADKLATNDVVTIIQQILKNKTITDPGTGIMTVYADDNVTPLFTANIWEDAAATQSYRGQGVEHREALN